MDRRRFLQTLGAAAVAATAPQILTDTPTGPRWAGMYAQLIDTNGHRVGEVIDVDDLNRDGLPAGDITFHAVPPAVITHVRISERTNGGRTINFPIDVVSTDCDITVHGFDIIEAT